MLVSNDAIQPALKPLCILGLVLCFIFPVPLSIYGIILLKQHEQDEIIRVRKPKLLFFLLKIIIAMFTLVIPVILVEFGYEIFSNHKYQIFGYSLLGLSFNFYGSFTDAIVHTVFLKIKRAGTVNTHPYILTFFDSCRFTIWIRDVSLI